MDFSKHMFVAGLYLTSRHWLYVFRSFCFAPYQAIQTDQSATELDTENENIPPRAAIASTSSGTQSTDAPSLLPPPRNLSTFSPVSPPPLLQRIRSSLVPAQSPSNAFTSSASTSSDFHQEGLPSCMTPGATGFHNHAPSQSDPFKSRSHSIDATLPSSVSHASPHNITGPPSSGNFHTAVFTLISISKDTLLKCLTSVYDNFKLLFCI
jgi:hypothetical protein